MGKIPPVFQQANENSEQGSCLRVAHFHFIIQTKDRLAERMSGGESAASLSL